MNDHPNPLESKSAGCEEFQQQLPELFESGVVVSDHPHPRSCKNCSALVRDLEYIAEQAKQLIEPFEPRDDVWEKIEHAIQQEAANAPGKVKSR